MTKVYLSSFLPKIITFQKLVSTFLPGYYLPLSM